MGQNTVSEPPFYETCPIEVLEGLEPVRRRPGMYVGDVHDGSGLHHLVWEIVGNALDQHLARRATQLRVDHVEGWITIEDDGPGIPGSHRGMSGIEAIFTSLHSGATRDGHFPHVHVTPLVHGVGLAPINALCARLEVESRCGGTVWRAAFERGRVVEPVAAMGASERSGTRIRFLPDASIFSSVAFDVDVIGARLLELARVFPLLTIRWNGAVLAPEREGMVGWVRALAEGPIATGTIVSSSRTIDDVLVDVALAWDEAPTSRVRSMVNANRTVSGTHETGLRSGLLAVARSLGCTASPKVVHELLGAGLVAVLHVGLLDPRFGAPTRDQLLSPIAGKVVKRAVEEAMRDALARRDAFESFLRDRLRC